MDIFT
jgi:hypothetical protein